MASWPGASSLREIEAGLKSHAARLYHLGARPVAPLDPGGRQRATPVRGVRRAVRGHDPAQAHRGLRRAMADATYLIDSHQPAARTRTQPIGRASRDEVCGAKLHVIYDPDADRPVYAAVSTAKVNDITAAQAMPIEPGATYVFDLGYYDYRWWAEARWPPSAASSPASSPTRR